MHHAASPEEPYPCLMQQERGKALAEVEQEVRAQFEEAGDAEAAQKLPLAFDELKWRVSRSRLSTISTYSAISRAIRLSADNNYSSVLFIECRCPTDIYLYRFLHGEISPDFSFICIRVST